MVTTAYDFFDDIVCINLEHREDRKEISQKTFKALNINCRFHIVKKHPKGGMYGCFDSHIQLIKNAFEKGHDNLFIFEDDIKVTPSYTNALVETCIDFMKSNKKWEIFYFGYIPCNTNKGSMYEFWKAEYINNNIIKYRPFATHSYCINRKGMKKILDNYEQYIGKIHLDQYYVNLKLDSYCTVPMLFDQHLCLDSDNEAFNSYEAFARRFQCHIDMYNLLYKPTLLKYRINKHRHMCIINIITAVLLICVVILIVRMIHN